MKGTTDPARQAWFDAVQAARESVDKLGDAGSFLALTPAIVSRLSAEVTYTFARRHDLAGEDLLAGSCLALAAVLQRLMDEADVLRPFLPHAETSRPWIEGAITDALGDKWLAGIISGA